MPDSAFKDWGGGQVDGIGQFLGGQFCIFLQRFQYLQVCFI